MSFLTCFTDCKGSNSFCVKNFREGMALQHANRMGVYKCMRKDALTCWGNSCGLCYECTRGGCYTCGADIWECKCGFGNIRKDPELMDLHLEDYLLLIREHYE
jgi:hypothetical protein